MLASLLSLSAQSVIANEEFFVPFKEDAMLSFLSGISSDAQCDVNTSFGGSGNSAFKAPQPLDPVNTVTDFVVRVAGSIIVVDHYEDGYEADIAGIAAGTATGSSTTRVYGDSDISNGAVPGVTTNAGDVLSQGQVVVFTETVNTVTGLDLDDIEVEGEVNDGAPPRTQDGLDAGDRIFATETINVTRAQWAEGSGTLFAGAFELFPLTQWGTSFTMPVGEDSATQAFQWVGVTIMAANDGTIVSVDANADGDYNDPGDINAQTINSGETINVAGRNDLGGQVTGGLNRGAKIVSSDIIQTNIVTGQECSRYAARWFTLFPDGLLGNTYYEPVSTRAADATEIHIYNPAPVNIVVNWETTAGVQQAINVAAGGTAVQVMPTDSGARFYSNDSFSALTITDQNGGTRSDWGHASTSQRLMGNIVQVGFAEGDDPSSNGPVTAVASDDLLNWQRYDGSFADTNAIASGTLAASGTNGAVDLAGNTGDNFGLIYQGYFRIDRVGLHTFATSSNEGSRLFIDGTEIVNNDANPTNSQQTGTYTSTASGWVPFEVHYRELTGGESLTASFQEPGAGSLTVIPSNRLSSIEPQVASENGAPVWIVGDNVVDTTDTSFEICVDVSGDGGPNTDPNTGFNYDYTFTLNRLDSARLYDGGRDTPNGVPAHIDGDQSGMLAFVCDGSEAILAAAWGQAPDTASGANPALDVGTTVRSVSADIAFIGDTVYEDVNSNGIRDAGEPGIQGVTVILTPEAGVNLGSGPGQAITTQTDFNGSYLFTGLISGNYTVEVVPPSMFTQTSGPDVANGEAVVLDNIGNTAIVNAIGRLDQDFGYNNGVPVGEVGDFIYSDTNGNGIQDAGETGIGGIDVELCLLVNAGPSDQFNAQSYSNNSPAWAGNWIELNDDNSATTATSGDQGILVTAGGELSLRGNANGPSLTRQVNLAGTNSAVLNFNWRGFDDTYEAGDEVFIEVSTDGGSTFTTLLTLEGTDIDNATGTESLPFTTNSSADVRVRFRVNANNFFGGSENLFIDNVLINQIEACQTQTTNGAGGYLFTGLVDGLYEVTVLNPPAGTTNSDDPSGNADNANVFSLTGSGGNYDQDFGYFTPAVVVGHVYLDENGNGVQDFGEQNIADLDVEVTDSLGNLHIVTTDSNGNYTVSVPPGSTQVNIDNSDPQYPTGFVQTDGVDPNTVIAVAGSTVNAGDDGYYQGNVIGNTVYSEDDGVLGVQGGGDPGIPGVLVTLTPPAGVDVGAGNGVAITQITDSNGNYSFVGLPDGSYDVTIAQPSGSVQTEDPDGGNDNTSSVAVFGGITNNDQDFGYQNNVAQGLVGDRIYTDTNGNGVQDLGEPGIAGISVQICGDLDDNNGTANTCRTEITDADGDYLFGDLFAANGVTADAGDTALPATGVGEQYTVTVLNPPAGQINSQDPDAGLPNFSQLTLSTAGGNLSQDFGYFQPGTVTGHLYIDTNGDGVQQGSEPNLVAVDVIITDSNGNQQTVTSDGSGNYVAQVPPGTTSVDVDENDAQFPLNHIQTEGTDPTVVTVTAGANSSAGNDGYAPSGSIGDLIFFDSATGGVTGQFDAGIDSGIPGVTVTLTPPAGIDVGAGIGNPINTTTDANGNYSFGSLVAGTYLVTVTQPNNTTATIDPNEVGQCATCDNVSSVTIVGGEANGVQDFGYQSLVTDGQVGDKIFNDLNGNGVFDAGEPGIAGIEVQICGDLDGNDVTAETCRTEITDAAGDYLFGDSLEANGVTPNAADAPLPGTTGSENFTITVLNPPIGSTNTADPDGGAPNVAQLTLPSGISNLDQDFGYTILSFSGTVWLDDDLDGVLDVEEAGLTGVQVELLLNGVVVATTAADANGDYSFSHVLPGDYTVNVVDSSLPSSLTNTAGPNGIDPRPVTLTPGVNVEKVLFGYIPNTNTGVIGDRVWSDANGNGIQEPNEAGLAGVTLEVVGSQGNTFTTTTNANGDYLFTGLPFDTDYVVTIPTPTALVSPSLLNATPTSGPQSEGSYVSSPVNLSATASVVTDTDFGFQLSVNNTVTDSVWIDSDADGVRDAGEDGLPNVSINLYNDANNDGIPDDNDGDGQPDVVATTITDNNGNVSFTGLADGTYILGLVDLNNELGGYSGTTSQSLNSLTTPVSVSGGTTLAADSFGFNQVGLVSGTVYVDGNSNSNQDNGDVGLSGIVVTLTDSLGAVFTTTTGVDGHYQFQGLEADTFTIAVAAPGGTQTEDPEGAVNNEAEVTLAAGQSSVGNDFGYNNVPNTFAVDGTVFIDPDRDGVEDIGEIGIESITLNLIDHGDVHSYDIINGMLDYNRDGVITADDDGQVEGVTIIDGNFDTNGDGNINELDSNASVGSFAIVEGMVSIAVNGVASQSTTQNSSFAALYGNDGNPVGTGNGSVGDDLFPRTRNRSNASTTEYWEVDLGSVQSIANIKIFNLDDGNRRRISFTHIMVSDTPFPSDPTLLADARSNATFQFQLDNVINSNPDREVIVNTSGRYVRIQKPGNGEPNSNGDNKGNNALNFAEMKITPAFIAATSDGVIATTTTDASGNYVFTGLPNGDYQVAVTDTAKQLAGYDITSGLDQQNIVINNADVNNVDFGYIRDVATGSISGEVFIDENGNSTADDLEFNLSNVDVYLCTGPITPAANAPCDPSDAEFVAQTTADANGEYVFNNLVAGQYVIGTNPVSPSGGPATDIPEGLELTANPPLVALAEGEEVSDVDVGYEAAANTGILSGFVWTDINNNGVFDDNETPLGGVTINVRGPAGASAGNPNGDIIRTVTTAADGSWIAANIAGADLTDNLLVEYVAASVDVAAGVNLVDSQPTNLPNGDIEYSALDLASDSDRNISFLNFGFGLPIGSDLGRISGTVYSDLNQNGSYLASQDDEIQSVTINLVNSLGVVVATTTTDEFGNYSFLGLIDDTYTLEITDNNNTLSDLNPSEALPASVVINGANAVTNANAGFMTDVELGSIGNRFFFDTNGNGFADAGEPGIPGVTVQCWVDTNQSETPDDASVLSSAVLPDPGIDNLVRTVTTDENGEFYCTSLPAGQYIVVVADANGYSEADDGTMVTENTGDGFAKHWNYALTIGAGASNVAADFGVAGNNSINGTLFVEDENLTEPNGTGIGAGELDGVAGGPSPDTSTLLSDPQVTGVPVDLLIEQPDGTFIVLDTVLTNADGSYDFVGLPDGRYQVRVRPSGTGIDGYGQTGDPDLANVAVNPSDFVCDSPTASLCDNLASDPIDLDSGSASAATATASGVDFGYQRDFTTTPVTMSFFSATRNGDVVEFVWETSNEVGHAGFQIYGRSGDGWNLLSPELIIAESDGATEMQGNRYVFQASTSAKWFALVDVSNTEEVNPHGPFAAGQDYGEDSIAGTGFDWSTVKSSAPTIESVRTLINQRISKIRRDEQEYDADYESLFVDDQSGDDE